MHRLFPLYYLASSLTGSVERVQTFRLADLFDISFLIGPTRFLACLCKPCIQRYSIRIFIVGRNTYILIGYFNSSLPIIVKINLIFIFWFLQFLIQRQPSYENIVSIIKYSLDFKKSSSHLVEVTMDLPCLILDCLVIAFGDEWSILFVNYLQVFFKTFLCFHLIFFVTMIFFFFE